MAKKIRKTRAKKTAKSQGCLHRWPGGVPSGWLDALAGAVAAFRAGRRWPTRCWNPPTTAYILAESVRYGGIKRSWVDMEDMAPEVPRAVVAAEDANFCLHWGFDMAAIREAIDQGGTRGASTLTQQTVKNVFLWQGRSWPRKALEALMTPAVELVWTKRRTLEIYLNVAEFGKGVFGIEAAAQHYFGVSQGTERRVLAFCCGPNPTRKERKFRATSGFANVRADRRRRRHDRRRRSRRLFPRLNATRGAAITRSNRGAAMTRLYHVPLSPFCRKVRLTLAEKKVEVELAEERYWEQSPEFLRRNPAAKVPVLKIDGRLLSESQAICEYLEETIPEPRLMPRDPEGRCEVRRLCAWFDDKFHQEVTSKLLYERVNKKIMGQGYPESRNVKSGAQKIKYHLDYLSGLLDQRRWLAGNEMTLADFTAAAHLSSLDYISDVDWNRSQNVKDWYAKIKSRPAFRSILADQVPGFPPPAHYADLDF